MNGQSKRTVYADHAATVPITDRVRAAIEPFLCERFGNPSSIYRYGREASRAIFTARKQIAELFGCHPQEIYFTSGGTESDNLAVKGTAFAHDHAAHGQHAAFGGHMVATAIEHHAVLHSMQFLERCGMEVTYVMPDTNGIVSPDAILDACREDTVLVAVMLANNEIGTIQPIRDIADAIHEYGIPLFCDAVQGMGQIPVNPIALGADMLSLSGHKIGAPRGGGLLYVRSGTPLLPLIDGGGQEMGMRSGTENTAAIVGLSQAMQDAAAETVEHARYLRGLSDALFRALECLPHCMVNGTKDPLYRLPGNVNVSFPGLDAESMVLHLDRLGIAASAGSACTAGKVAPSHVLTSIGRDDAAAASSLRFTFGRENTMDDVIYIAEAVKHVTETLYAMQ